MVIWQLLFNQNLDFFRGSTPFAPLNGCNKKNDHPMTAYDHTFYFKILSYYQKEDVYKKRDKKIFIFGQMVSSFVRQTFFWFEPQIFFKISYLAQF